MAQLLKSELFLRGHITRRYAVVTTAIPLRFDGRSTVMRLVMKGP